ncbi:MAG: type II toxin-antitoxin system RelE/ParE family toxin [Gemmataceae bacterium]
MLASAQCDLRSITAFISREVSRASADRWLKGISTRIDSLESTADVWPEADESSSLPLDLRMMLYGKKKQTYRILYEIEDDVVQVHRVRHAAQDSLAADDFE